MVRPNCSRDFYSNNLRAVGPSHAQLSTSVEDGTEQFRKLPNIFSGAGLCWLRRRSDETCSGFLRAYNDEKECCGNGGVAFSNGASHRRIFFHVFVQRPSCKLCNSKSLSCYFEFTLPTFLAHLLSCNYHL